MVVIHSLSQIVAAGDATHVAAHAAVLHGSDLISTILTSCSWCSLLLIHDRRIVVLSIVIIADLFVVLVVLINYFIILLLWLKVIVKLVILLVSLVHVAADNIHLM